ncbi:transcriptional regulator AraC family [Clostridium aceticum]|uniref:Transcriptional regulator AraC family n=1 Tax=Clostridium aceticum TaxID=84022 RepID=A0A0D8IFJ6_9CLOT|nr:AraC family transcriptional regulator [Clostridium aceticum]AKL95356.1 transcriptional regulator AraC family [Clostridium aceticum]KJF28834.1 hypothetical protein TZ02_00335 [Clostridium aceticum]
MEVVYSTAGKKHILDNMEKFFLCTHLPIKALTYEGELIHTVGYNERLEDIYTYQKVFEKTEEELYKEDSSSTFTLSSDAINFTVFYICPRNVHRGVYIIGPYRTQPEQDREILYKPDSCIPHLISLLRNIAEDSDFIRQKKLSSYSLYVKKALDYMDAKYNTALNVSYVADYLGISKCYFCSILKKETTKTFTQVLNEIRIEKSKTLLLKGNQSILDIAISVGYNNQNYYNMIFKKLTKMTPLQFKNTVNRISISHS